MKFGSKKRREPPQSMRNIAESGEVEDGDKIEDDSFGKRKKLGGV